MRAEFFRPDAPDRVAGVAVWDGRRADVQTDDDATREALGRVFRAVSVAVEDSSTRPAGASGETVVEPGDLEWFRAAATVRGEREGLSVRFATETPGGWDPAGYYDPMPVWVSRREAPSAPVSSLGTPRA